MNPENFECYQQQLFSDPNIRVNCSHELLNGKGGVVSDARKGEKIAEKGLKGSPNLYIRQAEA